MDSTERANQREESREEGKPVIERIIEAALVLLLAAIVIIVLLQVFFRYVISMSLHGIEEMARLLFVWGCFLGAGLCSLRREHLRVDYLLVRLKPRAQLVVRMTLQLLILGISVIMMVSGTIFVVTRWVYPDFSTALMYPRSLFWVPVPLSGLIIFYATANTILALLRGEEVGPRGTEGEEI